MAIKFRLPSEQFSDYRRILKLGPESLRQAATDLKLIEQLPLTYSSLRNCLTAIFRGDTDAAAALSRQLLALNQLTRQRSATADDVMLSLRDGIQASTELTPEEKANWPTIEAPFKELLCSNPIRTVSKAYELAYDYANLFQGARIITDIRPVFNDLSGEEMKVDGAVVSYTLRLHFDDRAGDHSLSIALDEGDIHVLKEQCERALAKAQFVRKHMKDIATIPTMVSGEHNEDS